MAEPYDISILKLLFLAVIVLPLATIIDGIAAVALATVYFLPGLYRYVDLRTGIELHNSQMVRTLLTEWLACDNTRAHTTTPALAAVEYSAV